MPDTSLYGSIEAGGTKFVCALGTGPDDVRALTRFPTTTPYETLDQAIAFFKEQPELPAALGVGSFGPVDPDPKSSTFGHILSTPKPGWSNTDVRGRLHEALGIPIAFDTDVNAAALGEYRWGAGQDVETVLYLTVGTGIGGGLVINGQPLHGMPHPEMGHIFVPRAEGDSYAGKCPFHGDCLEGMASGPALQARWETPAQDLPEDHPAWAMEAHYLAYALVNFILTCSPQRLVLGGGVMHQMHLFPMIRERVQTILNGYVRHPAVLDEIDAYIVPPGLGDQAGVLGGIALAQMLNLD